MVKHGILHVHSEYSLNDSTQSLSELLMRAKELGCRNITLTDHGTLLGIIPFLDKGKEFGINTIPGVETYLEDRKHLIIVAKDYENGFLSISHAMREANRTQEVIRKRLIFPIMKKEVLETYFKGNSHVFATSACIQGPIGSILLENYYKIEKKKKIMLKAEPFKRFEDEWLTYNQNYLDIIEEEKKLKKEKTEINKYTKETYLTRINKKRKQLEELIVLDEKSQIKYDKLKRELTALESTRESSMNIMVSIQPRLDEIAKKRKECKTIADKLKIGKNKYIKLKKEADDIVLDNEEILYKKALEEAKYYHSIFPEFYIEIQNHGLEQEKIVMPKLVSIARELNIPIIAANDAHMSDGSDESIASRQLVRFNYFDKHQSVSDADRTMYLKSDEELFACLKEVVGETAATEAIENTKVLEECNVKYPDENHYPMVKGGLSFDEALKIARQKKIENNEWTDEYEERLRHETHIIKSMGYVDYHMVVKDFCEEMRLLAHIPQNEIKHMPSDFSKVEEWIHTNNFKTGVGVGPGRGSAAGSLVCYLLGITNIDPIKYGLLFERFLNPERVSMPDIDTDVKTSLRPVIIKYLKWKYGENAICSISTETKYAPRGAVQMAGRDRSSELYDSLPKEIKDKQKKAFLARIMKVSDMIPNEPDITLNKIEPVVLNSYKNDSEIMEVWKRAKLIEGKISSTSVHAGGIVISDNDDINDYIPLAWREEKKVWAAQCDMIQIEKKGMLKMDVRIVL